MLVVLGWRVLDIEGDSVKLVSEGTPLGYFSQWINTQDVYASTAVQRLTTNFSSTKFWRNGFSGVEYGTVGSYFTNKYTQSVRSLMKEDLDKLTGKTLTLGEAIEKYGSLIANGTAYYLATRYTGTGTDYLLWCVHGTNPSTWSKTHGDSSKYLGWGMPLTWDNSVAGHVYYWYGYGTKAHNNYWDYYEGDATNQTCGVRPVVTLNTGLTTERSPEMMESGF